MQTVKHVLEDLARFNPEARMEPEIEIGSISPVTVCNVTIPGEEGEKEKMGKEISELGEEAEDLNKKLDSHENLWGEVEELFEELLKTPEDDAGETIKRIRGVFSKAAELS